MYEGLGRRGGRNRTAGVRAREIPVDAHEGDCRAFLRRHELAAREAARAPRLERANFARSLRDRAADLRNIRCAIDHLDEEPDKAPGPNGRRLDDLDRRERFSLAQAISRAFREGTYTPGPVRLTEIPKGSGTGTRTIAIANVEDRLAQRALTQALQPFLDPQFDDLSFGYRPGRGREDALIEAENLTEQMEAEWWIVDDVADAFGHVPHRRLLEALHARGIDNAMIELIRRAINNATGRGIPQGSSLSPLLMNIYLDHYLDRRWRRCRPNTPLIRTADDMLVIARSEAEAVEAYNAMAQILIAAGMPLKASRTTAIRNINVQEVDWLGYRIQRRNGIIEARIGPKAWDKLEVKLQRAHQSPKSPIRANEIVRSWVTQQGASLCFEDEERVLVQVQSIALGSGFDETTPLSELRFIAGDARGRHGIRRRLHSLALSALSSSLSAGGSALRHRFSDTGGDEGFQTDVASPSGLTSSVEWDIFVAASRTDGTPGTLAGFLLVHRRTGERHRETYVDSRPYLESAVLQAVIRGLEMLDYAAQVRLWVPGGTVLTNLGGCAAHPGNLRRLAARSGRLDEAATYTRLESLLQVHRVAVASYSVDGQAGPTQNQLHEADSPNGATPLTEQERCARRAVDISGASGDTSEADMSGAGTDNGTDPDLSAPF
jgi:group II intron reverse transcriptase/maturase